MGNPASPRHLSLVRFRFKSLPAEAHRLFPFSPEGVYVFFGEIPNMPGHCVVADQKTGQLYSGFHAEGFEELAEEDV